MMLWPEGVVCYLDADLFKSSPWARVSCEVRRRRRVVGGPDEEALIRLASCVLMELEMEWEGRRYVSMEGKVYGRCL
ncbi:MAG: hypothetical protein DRP63_05455 [Planctomycetota bacterium]|nr:MAG: hypothetical protein DRP63_05455 [Planctomycetota bacterium]